MKWDSREREYWDVGEEPPFFNLTQNKLASIMMALIRCDGQLHDSHTQKFLGTQELRYPPRDCDTLLRISLPKGSEKDFEKISGFTLTEPPRISC